MPTFTDGNDTFTVSAAGTYDLDMMAGGDRLNVKGGDETLANMGDGNDLVELISGIATVFGNAGSDRFDIWASGASADGGADNDTVNVRGGSGLIANGGLGDDRFNFFADVTSVTMNGGDGNDDFVAYYHSVTGAISGGAGNDYFLQFVSGVNLFGGVGNDIYRVTVSSHAAIFENADEGNDAVQVARGFSYTLPGNVENMSVQGFGGSVLTAATLNGNALNNHIAAHNNVETINGLDGNDSIGGKGGNDTLNGGNGNDYLDGGTGNDNLVGGAGGDALQGRTGNDNMIGGTGNDTYYLDSLSDVVTENLGEGVDTVRVSIDGYTLAANVENGIVQSGVGGLHLGGNLLDNVLSGNSGDDTLSGDDGNDRLKGGDGGDNLQGGNGNDSLNGGFGHDLLQGGAGSDILDGGPKPFNTGEFGVLYDDVMIGGTGDDTYYVSLFGALSSPYDSVTEFAGEGHDTIWVSFLDSSFNSGILTYNLPDNVEDLFVAEKGSGFQLNGNAADNVIVGSGFEISGGDGNDTLTGGITMGGGNGNDTLTADIGIATQAFGGAGNDVIHGSDGSDLIGGGAGVDTMFGGGDTDYFIVSEGDSLPGAVDTIQDFCSGFGKGLADDELHLDGIDANTLVAGDQAFTYIGTNAFSGAAGQLRASFGKGGLQCTLYGDTNGDGVADFQLSLHLTGTGLFADDMVL